MNICFSVNHQRALDVNLFRCRGVQPMRCAACKTCVGRFCTVGGVLEFSAFSRYRWWDIVPNQFFKLSLALLRSGHQPPEG